ncbi:MAG TPA: hypothetical protein VFS43_16155 [Polyangiaceae bacterium]|nr:hypothetical protein [Polyangiaceae bacterium]
MRWRLGGWGLGVLVCLSAGGGLSAGGCQEPTQVELRLSTDLPCDQVHGTTVTVGQRGELEAAHPAVSLATCEAGADGSRHLGFVVFVPRGENDEAFAIKVVTAVSALSPDACQPGAGSARGYQGCIVARRELRYRPGHTLRLEVPMLRQCEGVECTVDSTCFDATTCMPAGVTCTKEACTIDDTPDLRFANPFGPGAAAGGAAGAAGGPGGRGEAGGQAGAGGSGGAGGQAGAGGSGGASGQAGAGGEAGAGSGASAGNGPGGSGGTGGQGGGGAGGGAPVVSQVAASGSHSCAIVGNGEVLCWGYNAYGQLGDGTTTSRLTPVPVLEAPGGPPLTGVQALALGYYHSCALLTGGEARCWGQNYDGQLGDGTTTSRLTPVLVLASPGGPPLTGVQALELGGAHSCALRTSGEARCWGSNNHGQLGDGTKTDRHTPVPVLASPGGPPLTGVQALALGGAHSCALLTNGEARCWGRNYDGELGDGTTTSRLTPVPALASPGGPPLTGVQALALGELHSCALLTGGEARCWGQNYDGQLGDGTQTDRHTPVLVLASPGGPPLTGVQALELGGAHSCALRTSGEARCWGSNNHGQLGDGTTTERHTPVPVLASPGGPPLTGVQALALGYQHSCALLTGGEARCWGHNYSGKLGDGTNSDRYTPEPVVFP